MEAIDHRFAPRDVVGGQPALDFVNTVTAWNAAPIDWLDGYRKLPDWALLAGVIAPAEQEALARLAKANPEEAEAELGRVKRLREALYAVFQSLIEHRAMPEAKLREVESGWKQATTRMRFAPAARGGVEPAFAVGDSGLHLIRDRLAFAALDLLREFPLGRARICPGCGWMFVDRSKGGRRIWCDMATCGNTAKSRRHYARTKRDAGR